jgi:hypothetical protein
MNMIVMPLVLKQLQQWDQQRTGVPGEHWATFGTGLALVNMARSRRSPWLRLAVGVVGVAFVWRAASGRDGFLRKLGEQADLAKTNPKVAPNPEPTPEPQPEVPSFPSANPMLPISQADRTSLYNGG